MGSIALVDPPRDEVVRIALAPGGLRLTTTVALAFGRRARSLASSDSPVREKPLPTKSTRALSASSGHPLASPPLPGSRLRSRFASWLGSPAPPPCVTSRERGSSCPSQLTCSSLDPMLQEQREVCFPLIHATRCLRYLLLVICCASLCKRGVYAPFSAQRRSRALFWL